MSVPQTFIRSRFPRAFRVFVTALFLCAVAFAQEQEAEGGLGEPSMTLKWVNFAILAVLLGYLMAKMLPPIFKSRTEEIQKGIAEARAIKEDADKRAAEVENKIQTLSTEIDRIRAESMAEMQQEGERIRQETSREVARVEAQSQQEIEAFTKTARRDLKTFAADLALNLAEQRVREKLDAASENNLVDDFVRSLHNQPGKEARN